jgi:uncharacterized protein YjaG (DUF416 family)
MTYKDFIRQLQKQTSTLSYEKGLSMAIQLCRKLLPDYQVFSSTHDWGDPRVLEEALRCCEAAQASVVEKETIDPLFERLYAVTPDTEDFGDHYGSFGLNAAAALLHALQYVKGQDPKDIYAIGTLYTDTIDLSLHEMDIEEEDEIENHPIMQGAWRLVLALSSEP